MISLARFLELACFILRMMGIPWIFREIYARHKVTIVNYHDPKPDVFAQHMAAFSRAYSFISINQLVFALEEKDLSNLPNKPLLVTLDDAHIGNAKLFPIMRKFSVPAVIYAVAGVVDTNRGFWFNLVDHGGQAMHQLKSMCDAERRRRLEKDFGHKDEREYDKESALTSGHLRELVELGGTVASHTLFHPLLDQCDDARGLAECRLSRAKLEEILGATVQHFALPNGNSDVRTRNWVIESEYRTCRTTEPGWVTAETDPFALPNFGISDTASVSRAVVQACGIWDIGKKLFKNLVPRG